ncbi:MAG: polysaccharide deacetylase family protein, partial [Terriglobia bacterium]
MAWAVRGRSSTVFAPSVWRGMPGRMAIALTFDDGPSPSTPALLRVLEEFRIRATFFQIGGNARRYPDIANAVASAGHEIGNHSETHPNFALQSSAVVHDEFSRAQDSLAQATGLVPTLLRVPYGVRWFGFR